MSDDDFEMQNEAMHDDADVGEDSADEVSPKAAKSAKATDSIDDDAKSVTAHNEARKSLEDDVAAFLARGGRIEQVADNVMADPPRKPQSNYGSRPI